MVQPRRDATTLLDRRDRPAGPTAWERAHQAPPARPARRRLPARLAAALLALAALVAVAPPAWEQLGSGWYARRAQTQLADELGRLSEHPGFSAGLAATTPEAPAGTAPPTGAPATPTAASAAAPRTALARLRIPAIGLDTVVVGGNSPALLRQGPGWMPGSAALGTPGNAVVSGHRTTYGAPFRRLDALRPGAQIIVSRPGHPDDVYALRATMVVAPGDVWVARPSPGVRLTLTTCHPAGSDRQRLVLQAELVAGEAVASALGPEAWRASSR